jgi:membrane protein DedA with SNARE-associated domain
MRVVEIHAGAEGYVLLFAWVFAEQVGLPVPAAPALIAAGALAARGSLSLVLLAAIAVAASVLADSLWYRAGSFGSGVISRFLRRRPDSPFLHRAERLFARYGSRSLVFAKFVPGLSLAAPALSGLGGMTATEFLLCDALGSLIWSACLTGIGYLFGSAILDAPVRISPSLCAWLGAAAALGFVAVGLALGLRRNGRRRIAETSMAERLARTSTGGPAELLWLACLITGDSASGFDAVTESLCTDNSENPFFAQWIATWARRLVIAQALGKVAAELRNSARRTSLAGYPPRRNLAAVEWNRQQPAGKLELQLALAAIDLFPRCALLLLTFERLPLEDASILLDADQELVLLGQAVGLTELARNLAYEQGWEAHAEPQTLQTV